MTTTCLRGTSSNVLLCSRAYISVIMARRHPRISCACVTIVRNSNRRDRRNGDRIGRKQPVVARTL